MNYSILSIKNLYDYVNNNEKHLELEDLIFIKDENWKKNIKEEYYQHLYLIYSLFKHPDIELEIRKKIY